MALATVDLPETEIKVKSGLPDLAKRINDGHAAVVNGMKDVVRKAIGVGNDLHQARANLGHGEWLPWLEKNCS